MPKSYTKAERKKNMVSKPSEPKPAGGGGGGASTAGASIFPLISGKVAADKSADTKTTEKKAGER